MKKILSIIFAIMLIFSCFAVSAFAEDIEISEPDYDYWGAIYYESQPVMKFSDDYKKLYVDGEPYSRFNASLVTADLEYSVDVAEKHNPYSHTGAFVDLTDEQSENIENIYIETNNIKNIYRMELYFNDGSMLTVYFLQDTYFDEYNTLISGDVNKYNINFTYPDGNIVVAEKSALFGEIVPQGDSAYSSWENVVTVSIQSDDGSMTIYVGDVVLLNDVFYYVDYKESGVTESPFYCQLYSDCVFHKITDEALLADLNAAQQRYYEDDYGVFYDDDTTDTVSAVFLIFVFAVIPAVIFVIFLIKAIRGKGIYKKIYGAVAAFCIAELAVFTIIAVIISNLN